MYKQEFQQLGKGKGKKSSEKLNLFTWDLIEVGVHYPFVRFILGDSTAQEITQDTS